MKLSSQVPPLSFFSCCSNRPFKSLSFMRRKSLCRLVFKIKQASEKWESEADIKMWEEWLGCSKYSSLTGAGASRWRDWRTHGTPPCVIYDDAKQTVETFIRPLRTTFCTESRNRRERLAEQSKLTRLEAWKVNEISRDGRKVKQTKKSVKGGILGGGNLSPFSFSFSSRQQSNCIVFVLSYPCDLFQ